MVSLLRITYGAILGIMLYVVSNACIQESLFNIPEVVTSNIWFKATLVDCYFSGTSYWSKLTATGRLLIAERPKVCHCGLIGL